MIYYKDFRSVEQNPADDRYHLLSEYLSAEGHPKNRISIIQEASDEHERYRHRAEDLYAVCFVRAPSGLD